jgi:RsiW-degrading membrane proteinase PrsW (M82 family)
VALEGVLADPLVLLLALAFLPALLYLASLAIRHPGPSARIALPGFIYGATLSLVVLVALYVLVAMLVGNPVKAFQAFFPERQVNEEVERDFVLICLVAPALEEAAKGFGVWLLGHRLSTRGDGVMLGASVGLGFAAIETFTYLVAALSDTGSTVAGATVLTLLAVAGVRSVTAAFVHPAATGLTGYGIARAHLRGRTVLSALPFYLVAVALHSAYNYLAAFLPPQPIAGQLVEVNLPMALLLAALAWGAVKRGVRARA